MTPTPLPDYPNDLLITPTALPDYPNDLLITPTALPDYPNDLLITPTALPDYLNDFKNKTAILKSFPLPEGRITFFSCVWDFVCFRALFIS